MAWVVPDKSDVAKTISYVLNRWTVFTRFSTLRARL